ncbi:hypothetical protein PENSPDRAFT_647643 [Peniophora sp. CONT]|nr:hypothetical protein PENSPDRAFT_647643 [Peniophora sp. CONT]
MCGREEAHEDESITSLPASCPPPTSLSCSDALPSLLTPAEERSSLDHRFEVDPSLVPCPGTSTHPVPSQRR